MIDKYFAFRKQRDTLSEAAVTLRTVVTFVTCLISRTEFLVYLHQVQYLELFSSCHRHTPVYTHRKTHMVLHTHQSHNHQPHTNKHTPKPSFLKAKTINHTFTECGPHISSVCKCMYVCLPHSLSLSPPLLAHCVSLLRLQHCRVSPHRLAVPNRNIFICFRILRSNAHVVTFEDALHYTLLGTSRPSRRLQFLMPLVKRHRLFRL